MSADRGRTRVNGIARSRSSKTPGWLRSVAAALVLVLPANEALAQRGSVSGQRASTSRTVSGNTSTRTTTAQTRSGQTATGTRSVSKEGDTVTVDRQAQSSSGASVDKQKEYQIDDGRVESVDRTVAATDRYGRTAQWDGKAEREGNGWEFEGEGKNRAGQNVEVDGYGARGYYGSGVVADVEGGRYGNRTVVAGRAYGGPAYVSSLPYGARPYTYHGRPYYMHGGVYYRPYPVHGVVVYGYIPPPYYVYYPTPPVGAIVVTVAALTLLYSDGAYYKKTSSGGTTQYQVVPAPAGASVPGTALPPERAAVTIAGQTYFLYGNTFYRRVVTNGQESFVAVTRPAGVLTVRAMPPDIEAVPVGSLTYFRSSMRYYLAYLDPSGEELYVVVDTPAGAKPPPTSVAAQAVPSTGVQPASTAPPRAVPVKVDLSVPSGASVPVVFISTLSSESAKAGQTFQAYLNSDLTASGRLVAPKGAKVHGRVVEAKSGTGLGGAPLLVLELTDIEIGSQMYALSTTQVRLAAEGKKPGKKIVGGALLGAGIGGIIEGGDGAAVGAVVGAAAGTAAAAASSGNHVGPSAGSILEFPLARALTVSVLVPGATAS
jgi:hypothetical protein